MMEPSSIDIEQLQSDIRAMQKKMADIRLSGEFDRRLTDYKQTDRKQAEHSDALQPLVDEYHKLLQLVQIWARSMEDSHRRLEQISYRDELTGLSNRRHFRTEIEEAIARSNRNKIDMAVMFLDLDHFKLVNDQLGHHMGDLLLKKAAKRIQGCLRDTDRLARIGGDEFAIIAENVKTIDDVSIPAKRIISALTEAFDLEGEEAFVGASIGISLYPEDAEDADNLLMHADIAMYKAKESRGAFVLFDQAMNVCMENRIKDENKLRAAIQNQEFEVYFQPKVDVQSGQIVGSEALLRWPQADGSMISPMQFIPLAEETRLIEPLGEWVLFESCKILHNWRTAGFTDLHVSINASAVQLQNKDFPLKVSEALQRYELPPHTVEIEITETLAMQDPETVMVVMQQLSELGISIALDDFGIGHSSLGYLKKFPINILKLDREFIKGVIDNPDDAVMTSIMIQMAHQLGIKVVAEGVELETQRCFLAEKSCDMIQGYLFSPPIPAAAFTSLLTENTTYPSTTVK